MTWVCVTHGERHDGICTQCWVQIQGNLAHDLWALLLCPRTNLVVLSVSAQRLRETVRFTIFEPPENVLLEDRACLGFSTIPDRTTPPNHRGWYPASVESNANVATAYDLTMNFLEVHLRHIYKTQDLVSDSRK